ncbi:MAG: rRNA maturation RNase YbeY [Acholeplasmataceae bacterium]
MKINIHNQTDLDIKPLEKLLKRIFRKIKQKKSMELIFVMPNEMKQLNLTYRNMDKTTDVLSFINDDVSIKSFGDVFINLNQAFDQARSYGHTYAREVGFLAIHGYLHLIGYDHHTEAEEKKMILEQKRLLALAKLEKR